MVPEKYLNIISFNVPYPANYGGVIDVFYKLKALSENGIKIILHTFRYGREEAKELEKYCYKVFYYIRNTGLKAQFSSIPYIVYSRKNEALLQNLLQNSYPILFEGLHTTYYLNHPLLKNRLKLVRAHNIEHKYYKGLSKNADSWLLSLYFKWEAFKLKRYEKQLVHADYILSLSTVEKAYFENKFGKEKTIYLPLFFNLNKQVSFSSKAQPYILYHGNLSTAENVNAIKHISQNWVPLDKTIHWVFAGLDPVKEIIDLPQKYENVKVCSNLTEEELSKLIENASSNILYTNQVSGVKLKLLRTLNEGKYCFVSKEMIAGSGLEELCIILPEKQTEVIDIIKEYINKHFEEKEFNKRQSYLSKLYDNDTNAQTIIKLL